MTESNEGKEGCCSDKGCGCGGRRKCCGGKAFGLLALLLIVGVIGYLIGKGHCGRMMGACPFSGTPMMASPIPGK